MFPSQSTHRKSPTLPGVVEEAAFWGRHPWALLGIEGQEEWEEPGKHQGKKIRGLVTDQALTVTAVLVLRHLVRGGMRLMVCTSTGRLHVDDGTESMDYLLCWNET